MTTQLFAALQVCRSDLMRAGMYLGELTRLALQELTSAGALSWNGTFTIPDSSNLTRPWAFPTALMARIGASCLSGCLVVWLSGLMATPCDVWAAAGDISGDLGDVGSALLEECKVETNEAVSSNCVM